MKRNAEDVRALLGLLENDMANLEPLVQENARANERISHGADDALDYAALGYTIHNLYSFMESYMLRIAKTFENNLGASSWHSDLLDRMASEVVGVRPRFFEQIEADLMNELRAFRHVFRNVYRSRLKSERVLAVQKLVPDALATFRYAHARFRSVLLAMVKELDEEWSPS